jgi:transposase
LIDLTDDETSVLQSWAQGDCRVARRAKAVLAAASTDNIAAIGRCAGLARASVYFWLARFRNERLHGLFNNAVAALSSIQWQQLEKAKSGSDPRFAKRAAFILDVAQSANVLSAAEKVGIRLNAGRFWLRVFKREGVDGLTHPRGKRVGRLPKLDSEEFALLQQWSGAGQVFSRRATVVLALAQGESVPAVAARLGITKARVFYWRNRLIRYGLGAIAPKNRLALPDTERDLLEALQNDPSPAFAKRASLLLDLCTNGDLVAAAKRRHVSLTAARNWKRAYEERGVAGLRKPKLAPPAPPPRSHVPLVFPIELAVELQVFAHGRVAALSGITTNFSSRYLTVSLNREATELIGKKLCRVSAEVYWPARTPDGQQLRLQIQGSAVQAATAVMRIAIRTFGFNTAPGCA